MSIRSFLESIFRCKQYSGLLLEIQRLRTRNYCMQQETLISSTYAKLGVQLRNMAQETNHSQVPMLCSTGCGF
ncbi:zinc finger AN1-type containing 6, partial [Homo sapiens]